MIISQETFFGQHGDPGPQPGGCIRIGDMVVPADSPPAALKLAAAGIKPLET
jgi:hypothetical protein